MTDGRGGTVRRRLSWLLLGLAATAGGLFHALPATNDPKIQDRALLGCVRVVGRGWVDYYAVVNPDGTPTNDSIKFSLWPETRVLLLGVLYANVVFLVAAVALALGWVRFARGAAVVLTAAAGGLMAAYEVGLEGRARELVSPGLAPPAALASHAAVLLLLAAAFVRPRVRRPAPE